MALGDFRLLTFDIMGTLIDYEAGILAYLRDVARAAGLTLTDRQLLEALARAEEAENRKAPAVPYTRLLEPVYQRLAHEFGLPAGGREAEGLRRSIAAWPAFADSVEALKALKGRFRLVALSNADNWAYAQMASTLGEPFDDAVTAEDVGVNKPDPQMFAYCRGRQSAYGYRLPEFLHVAQSQYHDIGVAKRLGFKVCWIERRRGEEGFGATPVPETVTAPDYHFATLAELAAAVAAGD